MPEWFGPLQLHLRRWLQRNQLSIRLALHHAMFMHHSKADPLAEMCAIFPWWLVFLLLGMLLLAILALLYLFFCRKRKPVTQYPSKL